MFGAELSRRALLAAALLAAPAGAWWGRMDNPAPLVYSVSPASMTARDAGVEVSLAGRNFISTSAVAFNGSARTARLLDSTRLKVILRPGDVAQPGTFPVVVTNPPPGGGGATIHLTVK